MCEDGMKPNILESKKYPAETVQKVGSSRNRYLGTFRIMKTNSVLGIQNCYAKTE